MEGSRVIRITLPAELAFRDLAVRAVASACRLVCKTRSAKGSVAQADGTVTEPDDLDLSDRFAADVVSAVSEIFNNVALHSYAGGPGEVAMEITVTGDSLTIVITDTGQSFDIGEVPLPELESLPEGGMGIHIARACMDELDYTPGPPNTWRLIKYAPTHQRTLSTQA